MGQGLEADPAPLSGTAATLHDLARDLQKGQFDLFLLDWTKDPASHPDMSKVMCQFGEFAHDQHQDAVALPAALLTRVADASASYQQTDGRSSTLGWAKAFQTHGEIERTVTWTIGDSPDLSGGTGPERNSPGEDRADERSDG